MRGRFSRARCLIGVLLGLMLGGGFSCGTLTPPGDDGGVDSGTVDSGAPGEWVELSLPADLTAPFGTMTAYPGAVYALVGENTVLHSAGGSFDWVTTFESPVVAHLAATHAGHTAYTVFQTMFVCAANCGSSDSYEERSLPRTPIALCGGDQRLAALTTATDAGAAVLNELDDGGWSLSEALEVIDPQGCARLGDAVFITEQGAVFNSFTHAAEHISVAGREGALEPWRFVGTGSNNVFVSSELGAVARRDALGVWTTAQVTSADITALAVESDDSAWVSTGHSLFRYSPQGWVPEGAGPTVLTGIAGMALQPSSVYVGGVDAAGRPRIFRRQR